MKKLREYKIQGIRASVYIRILSPHVWDPKINKLMFITLIVLRSFVNQLLAEYY